MYFVFTTTPHIGVPTRRFDGPIRAATVQASETVQFLNDLSGETADG